MSLKEKLKNILNFFGYKNLSKYDKIYSKRFKGLTEKEKRYIIEIQFKTNVGYKLNLDNPKSFNEKIQWLKLFYHDPLQTKCADKLCVRDYIKEKVGEKYLVPIIGVFDSVNEIDFERLPDKFVMKINWGSGQNIIVKNKSKLNIEETKEKLNNWLKPENNHYYNFLEWVYKNIKPKILIENFIESFDDLIDYKFLCYNGNPKNMFMVQNRTMGKNMNVTFYDLDFNMLPFNRYYKRTKNPAKKSLLWDDMLKCAKILSKPFPFVRVDFYVTKNNNLKIGELTFYPGNGTEIFDPIEWDYKLGEMLILPDKKF